jgi:hypothetical protein
MFGIDAFKARVSNENLPKNGNFLFANRAFFVKSAIATKGAQMKESLKEQIKVTYVSSRN